MSSVPPQNVQHSTHHSEHHTQNLVCASGAGAKNEAAIKRELTKRLKDIKAIIPWGQLRLPAEDYFEHPTRLTFNEHKAVMQVRTDPHLCTHVD